MSVILNRWLDDGERSGYENEVVCDKCGKPGTVNVFVRKGIPIGICRGCLEEMRWEIDNAIFSASAVEGQEQ